MNTASPHIGLFGTFDLKNYGDLIFPDVFRHEMGKRIPGVRVTLFSPIGGIKPFTENDVVFPIRDLGRIHAKDPFSAFVIGGGDLVRLDATFVADTERYRNDSPTAEVWIPPILFGHFHGIPVLFNAPGVPFEFSERVKPLAGKLFSFVDYLSVRDEPSRNKLASVAPDLPVEVIPDTVCLYRESFDDGMVEDVFRDVAAMESLPERYALFQSIGLEPGLSEKECATILGRLEDASKCPVILMPIGYVHPDSDVLTGVSRASGGRFRLVNAELSLREMFTVIGHAEWFVGTSMHGCLTAMQQGVPAIAVNSWDIRKLDGMMSLYGMERNVVRSLSEIDEGMLSRRADAEVLHRLRMRASSHFDKMAEIILVGRTAAGTEFDGDVLSNFADLVRDTVPAEEVSKVYFDFGEGFDEGNVQSLLVLRNGDTCCVTETVAVPSGCRRIRIDPAEGAFLRVSEASFLANGEDGIPPQTPGGLEVDGKTAFLTLDPQFVLEIPEGCATIEVRIRFEILSESGVERAAAVLGRWASESNRALAVAEGNLAASRSEIERLRSDLEASRSENERLRSENERLRSDLEASGREADHLRARLGDSDRAIRSLQSSLSWRITAPLRCLAAVFAKRNAGSGGTAE